MKLAKAYQPDQYEPTTYALWETSGVFAPTGQGEPYSIVMPPPNANGNLHIGHGLMVALEDILIRWQRMKGKDTIWIPGADHAGFETWVVYERELQKQGKSRFDFSREQLYSQVWNFVDEQRGNMELQLRTLGASCSWDDLVFTLDEKVIKTTHSSFKKLWDKGLVYRGERMVSYCTTHQTGFADIEVEHKTEKGKLWKIAYPSLDKVTEVVIATTRPETMLGDVAVAVHPDDPRYKDLIGTRLVLPLTNREIPIIADSYVDREYGTGAVKITPAHDPNDFEIGQRHDLPHLQVIGFDGKMMNTGGAFDGLTVDEARRRVLMRLGQEDLLRGEETIEHSVGHCYKCHAVIQPLMREQWFLNVQPLAQRAAQAIRSGEVTFYPASKAKALLHYYENIRDWNLSRQIAWGIPIPAFQNTQDPSDWIFDERVDQQTIEVDGKTYVREEDTFDTWFSSGQWPFIVADVLEKGKLQRFYPSSVMETGHDILFPWVSRMLMLGLELTDTLPFTEVYLHGLVNDEHGQKMSKSKGNVINPMEIVAKHGSDAFRMGIVASRSAGQDQAFSEAKVIAGRNFCNKLWNVARFIEQTIEEGYKPSEPVPRTPADHWIIRQLSRASTDIDHMLSEYRFAEASELLYHTVWDDVADWYIEASKQQPDPALLTYILSVILKLAHPFAPFVTETIWQTLEWFDDLLIAEAWPEVIAHDDIAASEFERIQAVISELRFVQAELPKAKKYELQYHTDTLVEENSELIARLARLKAVTKTESPQGMRLANSGREAWLAIDAKTLEEHQSNLEVRLAEAHQQRKTLEIRLANPSYAQKAPEQLVAESKKQLEELVERITRLQRELEAAGDL